MKTSVYTVGLIASTLLLTACASAYQKESALEYLAEQKADLERSMTERAPASCPVWTEVTDDAKVTADYRLPPFFPPFAKKSGHCKIRYNTNVKGETVDIIAQSCTDNAFEQGARHVVSKWRHTPKLDQEVPVNYCGVETKITFKLVDARGKLIPE